MTRRNTTPGESIGALHSPKNAPDVLDAPKATSEKAMNEILNNVAHSMFTMCAQVDRNFKVPEVITVNGFRGTSSNLDNYAKTESLPMKSKYGLLHYDYEDTLPDTFDDFSFVLLGKGQTFTRMNEVLSGNSGMYAPGGLLALNHLIETDGFKKMITGTYVFPGFVVLDSNGEWCVLEVNIIEQEDRTKGRKAVPYLVPLISFIDSKRYVILQKK